MEKKHDKNRIIRVIWFVLFLTYSKTSNLGRSGCTHVAFANKNLVTCRKIGKWPTTRLETKGLLELVGLFLLFAYSLTILTIRSITAIASNYAYTSRGRTVFGTSLSYAPAALSPSMSRSFVFSSVESLIESNQFTRLKTFLLSTPISKNEKKKSHK